MSNYTIPTRDLKSFFSKSNYLSGIGMLPIYQFVRIVFEKDQTILHRCSNSSYYSQVVDVQNEPGEILIEADRLIPLLNAEAILFSVTDKQITLNGKVKCTRTTSDWPIVPVVNSAAIDLDDDTVAILKRAVKFLYTKDTTPNRFNHVFVGSDHICASSNHHFYFHSLPTAFKAALYPEMINPLPGACSLMVGSEWCKFTTLTSTYMFRNPEIAFFDMSTLAPLPEKVGALQADQFFAFLKLASDESKSDSVVSTIDCNINCICHTPDSDYGIEITETIDYSGEPFAFSFNVAYMLGVVSLMTGEIGLYPKGDALYMSSGEGFTCIVMRMFNQQ